MATTSTVKGWGFNESADGQDGMSIVYEVQYDDVPLNPYTALALARSASGEPVPPYRHQYATTRSWMFAQNFTASLSRSNETCKLLQWTVNYAPPPAGEDPSVYQYANPLDRPPVFNVAYISEEVPIWSAKNVEALAKALDGANRAAGTEGAVTNAAGDPPADPLLRTKRWEVLVMTKNYPSLDAIVARNREFKETTNSDSFKGYGARELEYQLTESSGVQYENGVEFWPGVTEIICRPTDLVVDNVGFNYWDGADKVRYKVKDPDTGDPIDSPEPANLALNGSLSGAGTTQITYRDLIEKSYAGLLT